MTGLLALFVVYCLFQVAFGGVLILGLVKVRISSYDKSLSLIKSKVICPISGEDYAPKGMAGVPLFRSVVHFGDPGGIWRPRIRGHNTARSGGCLILDILDIFPNRRLHDGDAI